ncbi:hypothetical protein ACEUDE_05685 [Aeromonas veronii]
MQILTGQKGDRLDKALTLREAAELGMVNLRRNGSGQIVPELPPDKPTDPEWSGVQQPVAPTGVTADGAFHTITLTWDIPAYKGHSYAEILRAEVDNPSSAVAIGTTLANVYSDSVGKGFSAFYWVRFVNKNGMVGPLNSTAGLHAATSPDVDEITASATNFAIYNPAKPAEKEIIFGVTDGGKVAIREAVIKAATIQIIHSEKITADYIKAGVSISAPLITGGQFDMGNAFMSGGAAGFGKGGPYGGWGWGWHTIIYSDGSIYTNKLNADGGYVRNMTIGNCTIQENCEVLGTVYADRIVGDVYGARGYTSSATGKVGDDVRLLFITVKDTFGKARVIHIPDMCGYCEASASYNKPTTLRVRVYATLNGVLLYDKARSVYIPESGVENTGSVGRLDVGEFMFELPANASGGIDVRLHLTDGRNGEIRPGGFGVVSIFKQSLSLG